MDTMNLSSGDQQNTSPIVQLGEMAGIAQEEMNNCQQENEEKMEDFRNSMDRKLMELGQHFHDKLSQIHANIREQNKLIEHYQAITEQLKTDKNVLQSLVDEKTLKNQELSEQIKALTDHNQGLIDNNKNLDNEIRWHRDEVAKLKMELEATTRENAELKKQQAMEHIAFNQIETGQKINGQMNILDSGDEKPKELNGKALTMGSKDQSGNDGTASLESEMAKMTVVETQKKESDSLVSKLAMKSQTVQTEAEGQQKIATQGNFSEESILQKLSPIVSELRKHGAHILKFTALDDLGPLVQTTVSMLRQFFALYQKKVAEGKKLREDAEKLENELAAYRQQRDQQEIGSIGIDSQQGGMEGKKGQQQNTDSDISTNTIGGNNSQHGSIGTNTHVSVTQICQSDFSARIISSSSSAPSD